MNLALVLNNCTINFAMIFSKQRAVIPLLLLKNSPFRGTPKIFEKARCARENQLLKPILLQLNLLTLVLTETK